MRTSHFQVLCEVVRRLDLRDDPRFGTIELRVENRAALLPELRKEFVKANAEDLIKRLQAVGVMAGKILNYGDWLKYSHVTSVAAYTNSDCPGFGMLPVVTIPGTVSIENDTTGMAVPGIGEHSRTILSEAGYSSPEIDQLLAGHVVRTCAP